MTNGRTAVSMAALLLATAAHGEASPVFASAPVPRETATPLYKQAKAPIEARVRDLLLRMTLEEKVAQLQGNSPMPPIPNLPVGPTPAFGIVKEGVIDETVARRVLSQGLGFYVNFAIGKPLDALENAAVQDAIQRWVLANTRLGIPVMFRSEALHGVAINGATIFPQAIALGSTWDPALIRRVFGVVGKEARAGGMAAVLAPVFDLARDPRYGRVEEMYSEDPYLVGEMGTAAVQGLQGITSNTEKFDADHVIATGKHFVHGQPESGTNTAPSDYSERTMRNVFFPPFEKAIRRGYLAALMPSYNENDGGIPSHANPWLLKDVLRGEWGFTGITDSDWFAVGQLYKPHGLSADLAGAGVLAFNSGVDVESPNGAGFATLAEAVRAGKVLQTDIDAAVSRVLTLKFRAGLFERPLSDPRRTAAEVGAKANIPLARKVADEAIILLRNQDGLLPLDPAKVGKIAVIGPNANKVRLGGYSATPPYFVTVLDGIRKRLGTQATVSYAEGARISEPDRDPLANKTVPFKAPDPIQETRRIAEAVATARTADVVVLVLGGNETTTREALSSEFGGNGFGDTDDLNLPGRQSELVREIVKLGKPVVAVLLNGRAHSILELSQTVPAILEGWYLGQETGNAVAGLLFGDVNPSGKLTVTVPRNVGQVPAFYYHTPQGRLGYVFNDIKPLYPFGFGLSYTSFTYGKPTLDRVQIAPNGTARVSVAVTNSGARAGDEIVQMYVHPKMSSVVQPVMRLAGFERVALKPGQTRTVSFNVGPEQLAIINREMNRVVEPGTVQVMVGPNSAKTMTVELDIAP